MRKTRAWELLCDPRYCAQLTMGGLYQLMLRAGYSKDAAQEAAKEHGWNRMCVGEVQ